MVKNIVVAILLSLVCNTLALNENFSPVLLWKHKDNPNVIENSVISATTKMSQRDFESRVTSLLVDQKIVFFILPDLCPEDLGAKNEDNIKAFQNIASKADIVEYIPYVENAADNKVTQGNNVVDASVSTTNDLEPEPSSNAKVIVVQLPGYHESESKFHWLARCDRAMHGVSQKYKDALFILSSEKNSRLQQQEEEHSRKRRAADDTKTGTIYNGTDAAIYFEGFFKHMKNQKKDQDDTQIAISESDIEASKKGSTLIVSFKSEIPITLVFDLGESQFWSLNITESSQNEKKPLNVSLEMGAPTNFSFSCTSGVRINVHDYVPDVEFVYFKRFQIQPIFDGKKIDKFADSYDCTGFTSAPIWAGLFITFLLLGIIAGGISCIMDIRTMDRFDDPKGKTITVTASE